MDVHGSGTDGLAESVPLPGSVYLATMGGGAFLGKVGCFEEGNAFDAVVLDDSVLPHPGV